MACNAILQKHFFNEGRVDDNDVVVALAQSKPMKLILSE